MASQTLTLTLTLPNPNPHHTAPALMDAWYWASSTT